MIVPDVQSFLQRDLRVGIGYEIEVENQISMCN
jgi:hypothetical protein